MNVLPELGDHTRVWIYTSNRELTEKEENIMTNEGLRFVSDWKVHGKPMVGGFQVVYNRFVVIAADEQVVGASGCSIDSSVRLISQLEQDFDIVLKDKLNLAYRDASGDLKVLPMAQFQSEMEKGNITEKTTVFNNLVEDLGQFRSKWETPLIESWHKQLL